MKAVQKTGIHRQHHFNTGYIVLGIRDSLLEVCEIEKNYQGGRPEIIYFTQQFPFIPQGKTKAILQSYISNVQFVFDGIQSVINHFGEGLNRKIDDDW